MIRDIAHNVKQRKKSSMLIAENDSELYLKYQELTQITNEFYKVFNTTINTHVGKAGYHLQVYINHLVAIKDKYGITVESLAAIDADDRLALKKKMEYTAMASSCKGYLACLFLLMADDGRYKPLKTELEKTSCLESRSTQRPFWRPRGR